MVLRNTVLTGFCTLLLSGSVFAQENFTPATPGTETQNISELESQIQQLQQKLAAMKQATPVVTQSNVVIPEYVKMIGDGEPGYNHSNPIWAHNGKLLGLERHDERNKEILIVGDQGEVVQTVKYQGDEEDSLGLDLLLPEFAENVSYNSGISWSPDNQKFVFMSNGSEGNYDLYLGNIGTEQSTRLTVHGEKDGHAHWSPKGDVVAFISGRNGNANLYTLNTVTNKIKSVSNDKLSYLYPQWSPAGDKIAVIHGSNQNHDVFIYDNPLGEKPVKRKLISWDQDDLRPIWSPNGDKIAFYTNYNEENDPKVWSIAVVDANSPTLNKPEQIIPLIVATNIIPDVEKGPAWMPDNKQIVFVKNNRKKYNPIEIVNVETGNVRHVKTNTNINHDINVSPLGVIAFRSQVDQWDHIFVAKIPGLGVDTKQLSNSQ